jgi:hypothetical protein
VTGDAADEELTFEAVVPMTREALVGSIIRRVGAKGAAKGFWRRGEIGPIAAWKTEHGFELRRSGLFSMPIWITLDARVDDVGAAACRVHGRVAWDSGVAGVRRDAWVTTVISAGVGVFFMSHVGLRGLLHPFSILFALWFVILPTVQLYRQFYAPSVRRRAPEHRKFLVEWLERLIDAPVTVRRAGGEP